MPRAEVRAPRTSADENQLVRRLRAGDEQAFEGLVAEQWGTMMAVAQTYVKSRAVAEEVVQETWVGVLQGLDRFEARSSLKTWILAILVNKAKTRGVRESRTVPFSALAPEGEEAAVEPERFRAAGDAFPGHWRAYPSDWRGSAAVVAEDHETVRVCMRAIAALPATQQTVIRMRDVEGYASEEVCEALGVSEGNQRVLLHRARSRVRAELERHFDA
jgi:RNA polymerase sigma-70 factor (ECF subfamily)